MPARVKLGSRRAEILRLVLQLLRLSVVYNKSEHYGSSIADAMICAAIYIGQYEKRPMTAGKIATYVGIPRPTVIRHLNSLVASGHVEKPDGVYQLPIERLNTPAMIGMVTHAEQLIHSSAAKLSKMDTLGIAKK